MFEYFEGVLKKALAENIRLLNGILPHQVADELKENGYVEPVYFEDAAVIFTDFEDFSQFARHLEPAESSAASTPTSPPSTASAEPTASRKSRPSATPTWPSPACRNRT